MKKIFFFGALLVFSWYVRSIFFDVPLERDEGEYAYIAQLIDGGGVPYKDAIDQKPPAVFFIYLLIFKIIGTSARDIHVAAFFYNFLTTIAVFILAKKLYNENTALVAAFIYAFVSSERRLLAGAANTEIFMLLPMTASWALVLYGLDRRRTGAYFFGAGVCAAAAVLFKQVAGASFLGAVVFLLYIAFKERVSLKKLSVQMLYLFSGFALPLAATALYFYFKGAYGDFIYYVVKHNIEYSTILGSTKASIAAHFIETFKFILQSQLGWWLLSAFASTAIVFSKSAREKSLLFLLAASFIGVCAGFRFTLHYFLQLMPVLAILCAAGIARLLTLTQKISLRPARVLAVVLFACLVLYLPVNANKRYYRLSPQELCFTMYSGNPFMEAKDAAGYIEANSLPSDKVFILGSEPEILFYAKRRSASKYIFIYPLTMPYSDALEKQKYVLSEVEKQKPAFIVYVNYPFSIGFSQGAPTQLFSELSSILEKDYVLDGAAISNGPGSRFITVKDGLSFDTRTPAVYIFKKK